MTGNDFMSWILRSPFHGLLSNSMMLITFTGRKTHRTYTTPVSYYCDGGDLWVISSRNRTWWRNVRDGAEVALLLKREPVIGFAKAELDSRCVEARICEYIEHFPQAARSLGIRMENGSASSEDIARTARDRLFVRIKVLS